MHLRLNISSEIVGQIKKSCTFLFFLVVIIVNKSKPVPDGDSSENINVCGRWFVCVLTAKQSSDLADNTLEFVERLIWLS